MRSLLVVRSNRFRNFRIFSYYIDWIDFWSVGIQTRRVSGKQKSWYWGHLFCKRSNQKIYKLPVRVPYAFSYATKFKSSFSKCCPSTQSGFSLWPSLKCIACKDLRSFLRQFETFYSKTSCKIEKLLPPPFPPQKQATDPTLTKTHAPMFNLFKAFWERERKRETYRLTPNWRQGGTRKGKSYGALNMTISPYW